MIPPEFSPLRPKSQAVFPQILDRDVNSQSVGPTPAADPETWHPRRCWGVQNTYNEIPTACRNDENELENAARRGRNT